MSELTPFKEIFNADAVAWIADRLALVSSEFDRAGFVAAVVPGLKERELKARVEHIAEGLGHFLPADYLQGLELLLKSLPPDEGPPEGEDFGNFRMMPLLRYVSRYGIEHFEPSMQALRELTKRFSAEFDVRFFLQTYPALAIPRLHDWARDPDWRVRRLATEGSRPRLPWGLRLQAFVQDPTPVLEVLEVLKHDPHSAVRRSVANHLNDITKDHPARAVAVAQRWMKDAKPETPALVKHALRGLVKAGHADALAVLGVKSVESLMLRRLTLSRTQVRVGEVLEVTCELENTSSEPVRLLLDYAVHHQKANGSQSPKVFKWTERMVAPGERLVLTKKHSMRPVTTRVYYPGVHGISLILNGKTQGMESFVLQV